MKVYHGTRTEHGAAVVVEEDGDFRGLNPRHDLRRHTMDGFEWTMGGSGPAQLALALAADVLGDDTKALDLYQRLKFRLVGRLPHEGWVITEGHIRAALDSVEQVQGRLR